MNIRTLGVLLAMAALGLLWTAPVRAGDAREEMKPAQETIKKGTAWMLKTQNPDGGCGTDIGTPSDIGCTAAVGLALMSQGNTPTQGPYSKQVRKIMNYLIKCTDTMPAYDITAETGTLLQSKIGRSAHSFFAAVFLTQCMGEGVDAEKVRKATKKLVAAISSSQQADGTWAGQSWAPMLGTVMGWVSLRAADSAGLSVRAHADRTEKHILKSMETANQQGWMHDLYRNASGIRVLYVQKQADHPVAQKALKDVTALVNRGDTAFTQAGGEEYLAFHLITDVMLHAGGKEWERWYPIMRDKIVKVQNADGSWTGHHCITHRTFCTAMALLVLQTPNKYLPISNV